jgi:hypothetical protein
VKVLTHRLCYIEPAIVPEFGGETSSATEAKGPTLTQRIEEPAAMPKADKIEEPRTEETKTSEILSPSVGWRRRRYKNIWQQPPREKGWLVC